MFDLLPNNATPQERALDETTARLADVPERIRAVWNADTCPADALPWLAWALSVDQWDPAWTDEQKRETVRLAIEVQRVKGTIGAVRDALGALDIDARVLEWHRQQTPGDAYTYRLLIEAQGGALVSSLEQVQEAIAITDRTKSLRSHLEAVEVSTRSTAGPNIAAAPTLGHEIALTSFEASSLYVHDSAVVLI